MADDAPAPEPEGESPDEPTPAPEAIEWHAGMTSDEFTEAIMAARPPPPRSWVRFQVSLLIFERHVLRVQTISADSQCGGPLRLPLPPAARMFKEVR